MFNIQNYLGRFKKISEDKEEIKKTVREILKNASGADISADQIVLHKHYVKIKAEPAIKAVLFMKRQSILDAFKSDSRTSSIVRID